MKSNLSEKLNILGIRITEISDVLGTSRPTLYKYIQLYEQGEVKTLIHSYKKLFDFIASQKCLHRKDFYLYVSDLEGGSSIKQDLKKRIQEIDDETLLKKIKKFIEEQKNVKETLPN
jgi:predicted transcriptional regulator